jgi:inner membrane protein
MAVLRRSPRFARAACAFALAYLMLGVVQRERAEASAADVAAARGHQGVALHAKPAFGNLLLWKTFYVAGGRFYVDAVRVAWQPQSFPGESAAALDLERDLPWLPANTQQARDVERFRWFSSGFVARDAERPNRVIDVRYSMIPNEIDALWGIDLDPDAAGDAHARYFTSRRTGPDVRTALFEMLLGD